MDANVRSLTVSRPEAPPPSICNVTSHPICLALTASTLRRTHARAPLICDDPDLDLDPTRPRSRLRGANESGQGCGLRDEVSCSSRTSHDACSCCGHDATAQRQKCHCIGDTNAVTAMPVRGCSHELRAAALRW